MTIYLTGDTHGNIQQRFNMRNFPEQKELDPFADNYVIVLGDLGLVWEQTQSAEERYILKWLEDKPFTLLFIDGNHENHDRLAAMPVTEYLGGRVHKISDSVYHLMRGEMYNINGYSFFAFGGAASHDIDNLLDPENDPRWKWKRKTLQQRWESFRIIGKTWWEGEQATDEEFAHGIDTLDRNGWACDFVLTHTPPASIVETFSHGEYVPDKTAVYLEGIKEKLDYKHWFAGHLHDEANITPKDHLIYYQLFLLSNR